MSSTTATDNVVASTKHGQTATSGCLLPYIEGRQKEVASTKGVVNDFIPPDLLLSLKRFTGSDQTPPSKGNATLPPSRRNPTLPSNNKPVRMRTFKDWCIITVVLLVSSPSKTSR